MDPPAGPPLVPEASARTGQAAALPADVKHCWVADPDGTVPGLLLGWRHDSALGWLGRVVRPVRDQVGWLVMEDWLPADELRPAMTASSDPDAGH